ncbi:MAG: DNA translocase FtsK 4TM domain-containing protein [Alphaproteobacteria bacterium]|nr:DNA translocase FtsK 4TM domain-containing protein [Alphaproteobacteria bacterium]
MPRTRTIRRSSSRVRRKRRASGFFGRFLPGWLQAFAARRLVDAFALATFLGGGFLLLALISYNGSDPSWNSARMQDAGPAEINNWMGESGAWIADLFLQTLGMGSILFALVPLIWGVRSFNRQALSPLWLRTVALLVAGVMGALAFAQVPSAGWIAHPYMGSSAGTLLFSNLAHALSGFSSWAPAAIILTASVLTAFCGAYAAAIKWDEIGYVFDKILNSLKWCGRFVAGIAEAFIDWIRHHNDSDYRPAPMTFLRGFSRSEDMEMELPPRTRSRRSPRLCAEEAEEIEDEEAAVEDRPVPRAARASAHIPVVAPQSVRVPSAGVQQRFSLSDGNEDWELPALSMLESPPPPLQNSQLNEEALRKNAELLQNVLADFNVEGDIVSIHPGPVVTLYELEPAPGTKSAKVIALSDDIARSMSAVSVRVAVVPGRNVIGIELPNKTRQYVYMQELLESPIYAKTMAKLPLVLGKDIGGKPILADLAKMPHLLVAGTTGSGKSVAVNTMILSLLFHLSPEKCRFIMIDPKMLELSVYDGIPHLLAPVVTEPGKAIVSLKWTVQEMEERYRAMSKLGVRNIEGYNDRVREAARKGEVIMQKMQTGFELETGKPVYEDQPLDLSELPYIVVVVDEFADLMLVAGKDVENAIQRLAQMARAAGIHLIMATQRPSVDVITGVIKANFPTRISFQVTSKIDSRTILGEGGAEQLLGMGDMLYMAPGGRITRVHGPFVSDTDVEKVVNDLKAKAEPAYIDSITEGGNFEASEVMNAMFGGAEEKVDELYDQAVALVAREGKASTSFVQRYLQIGYNRAARIIEEMERQGVISKSNAVGKREVLISDYSEV